MEFGTKLYIKKLNCHRSCIFLLENIKLSSNLVFAIWKEQIAAKLVFFLCQRLKFLFNKTIWLLEGIANGFFSRSKKPFLKLIKPVFKLKFLQN
jgi:hypothetical protein